MQSISAHEAKTGFGKLLDTARREAVTIEKHGRPVAVLVSKEDYDEMQSMRLELLRAEISKGMEASENGDVVEVESAALEDFVEQVMSGTGSQEEQRD
ncbi:MAG: type II toxin-antitoxin system Phd/YefM family antitoxin [Gammaproteobacteria bacterium]